MTRHLTREVTTQLAIDLSSTVNTYRHYVNGDWVESNTSHRSATRADTNRVTPLMSIAP